MRTLFYLSLFCSFLFASCSSGEKNIEPPVDSSNTSQDTVVVSQGKSESDVVYFETSPVIDGVADDECWGKATWKNIDNNWLGEEITPEDFTGKFKLGWREDKLYVLVEVIDDTVADFFQPWDTAWWKDDCVEIFIDEDYSKGNHQFNHNAFAYHVGLNYDVVDLGPDSLPHLYNDHVEAKRTQEGNTSIWEFAINIFDESYSESADENNTVTLEAEKALGFMIAYCDNDHSDDRENFIGSEFISGEESERDRGWIDAGEFGKITLKK